MQCLHRQCNDPKVRVLPNVSVTGPKDSVHITNVSHRAPLSKLVQNFADYRKNLNVQTRHATKYLLHTILDFNRLLTYCVRS